MVLILFIISLFFAGLGTLLLADFFIWLVSGRVTGATIIGFQQRKSRGLKLPIVRFEDEAGEEHEGKAARIDQLLFLFNRPAEDGFTTVIYKTGEPRKLRIYGYINVALGVCLFAPLVFTLALQAQSNSALFQLAYAVIFAVVIFGGWALLKLIQRYY